MNKSLQRTYDIDTKENEKCLKMALSHSNIYCFYNHKIQSKIHVISLHDQRSSSEFELDIDEIGDNIMVLHDKGSEESIITFVND